MIRVTRGAPWGSESEPRAEDSDGPGGCQLRADGAAAQRPSRAPHLNRCGFPSGPDEAGVARGRSSAPRSPRATCCRHTVTMGGTPGGARRGPPFPCSAHASVGPPAPRFGGTQHWGRGSGAPSQHRAASQSSSAVAPAPAGGRQPPASMQRRPTACALARRPGNHGAPPQPPPKLGVDWQRVYRGRAGGRAGAAPGPCTGAAAAGRAAGAGHGLLHRDRVWVGWVWKGGGGAVRRRDLIRPVRAQPSPPFNRQHAGSAAQTSTAHPWLAGSGRLKLKP